MPGGTSPPRSSMIARISRSEKSLIWTCPLLLTVLRPCVGERGACPSDRLLADYTDDALLAQGDDNVANGRLVEVAQDVGHNERAGHVGERGLRLLLVAGDRLEHTLTCLRSPLRGLADGALLWLLLSDARCPQQPVNLLQLPLRHFQGTLVCLHVRLTPDAKAL